MLRLSHWLPQAKSRLPRLSGLEKIRCLCFCLFCAYSTAFELFWVGATDILSLSRLFDPQLSAESLAWDLI